MFPSFFLRFFLRISWGEVSGEYIMGKTARSARRRNFRNAFQCETFLAAHGKKPVTVYRIDGMVYKVKVIGDRECVVKAKSR